MINNDSSSVTLDEADQTKIGLVQNRLTVLQGEVLEATKNLDAIEKAIAQGAENKDYYNQLIESLKPEIKTLEQRRDSLKTEITSSEGILNMHQEESKKMKLHFDGRKRDHDDREGTLRSLESSALKNENRLSQHEKELEAREARVQQNEAAIKLALESLI